MYHISYVLFSGILNHNNSNKSNIIYIMNCLICSILFSDIQLKILRNGNGFTNETQF